MEPRDPFPTDPIEPRSLGGGGCAKPALVGCGVLLVLALLAVVLAVVKSRDLLAWSLTKTEEAVMAELPEDVGEAERRELAAAFEEARAAIRENRFDPQAMPQLQSTLLELLGRPEPPTREEIRQLIEVLNRLAGSGEPEPAAPEALPAGRTAAL